MRLAFRGCDGTSRVAWDATESDGSGEGVHMAAVDDAHLGGLLPSGVVRCAAMGDPKRLLVDVDLVEVEARRSFDVLVHIERQTS